MHCAVGAMEGPWKKEYWFDIVAKNTKYLTQNCCCVIRNRYYSGHDAMAQFSGCTKMCTMMCIVHGAVHCDVHVHCGVHCEAKFKAGDPKMQVAHPMHLKTRPANTLIVNHFLFNLLFPSAIQKKHEVLRWVKTKMIDWTLILGRIEYSSLLCCSVIMSTVGAA